MFLSIAIFIFILSSLSETDRLDGQPSIPKLFSASSYADSLYMVWFLTLNMGVLDTHYFVSSAETQKEAYFINLLQIQRPYLEWLHVHILGIFSMPVQFSSIVY